MPLRISGMALFCAAVALTIAPFIAAAKPTTAPSSSSSPATTETSATKPSAPLSPDAQPGAAPSTQQVSAPHFPTPQELVAQWKKTAKEQDAQTKVAYFDLSRKVTERPESFMLFSTPDESTTLQNLIERLHKARDDKDVKAVLITLESDLEVGIAQAQEIRDALSEIRRAGKKSFVYADGYDTAGYIIAGGATNVCMLEGGEIEMPGIGFETMFYKGALDKVGVKADYVQIGEYKGAEEPYTRTAPSPELRGELEHLCSALYDQIVDTVSMGRGLSADDVRQSIDDALVTGAVAKQRGLVDHLIDQDGLRDLIGEELGNKITLVHDYGRAEREPVDLSNPFAFFAAITKKPQPTTRPSVALVYADGVIVDGDGGESLLSQDNNVGSESMRKALRMAQRDDNVKAVVIRIDSPGGSALASEVMWQAARRVAKDKPLIVSVGGMAASGGYYLASSGDYIFADPAGIVGSIGVVGGKFVTKDLFDKVGLSTEFFAKGRNAGLFSSNKEWDERQRRMVRNWMQQTYDQFTQRVMSTRKGKIADIDKVARGRIFSAKQAKDLGMVDELGGLTSALKYAAGKAKLSEGAYDIKVLPAPRTLADFFGGSTDEAAAPKLVPQMKVTISPDSMLRALSPTMAHAVEQQLEMARLLQQRPVTLMTPYVMMTK
jgi:protease-4